MILDRDPSRSIDHVGHLCLACVRSTQVDGAAVTLLSRGGARNMLVTTDDMAARLERVQRELGEGPIIESARDATQVLVGDISADTDRHRWPVFAGEASSLGVKALFAFPLHTSALPVLTSPPGSHIGTLALYRGRAGGLGLRSVREAMATAVEMAALLLEPDSVDTVDSMIGARAAEVHQAAGMVMMQLDIEIGEALSVLQAAAFSEGVSLQHVATEVVQRRRRMQSGG